MLKRIIGIKKNKYPETVKFIVGKQESCDFKSITDCLNSIATNKKNINYSINVKNGIYHEAGQNGKGIELIKNVNIIGESIDGVIIKSLEAPDGQEKFYSTINKVATCIISNLTLYTHNNKYCIHADQGSPNDYHLIIDNCNLENENGYDRFDIGIGIYFNQKIHINNCILNGRGIFAHNSSNEKNIRKNMSFNIEINNSKMKEFIFHEYRNYGNDVITVNDSDIELQKNIPKYKIGLEL